MDLQKSIENSKEKVIEKILVPIDQTEEAQKILDISKREKYDLILMGRRQTGIIREFLMGSVSYKVTHHATCPVLIVE
jgi:nucleotide-binding universal stress UspA family protein